MPDWTVIVADVIAALTAGGWLLSRHRRRQEKESHEAEIAKTKAELTAALRDSETKYTREALEIYTQQVVEPLRQQLDRNTVAIARYQGAIDMAPTCRLYPDCVVIRKLRSAQTADDHNANGDDHDR